MVRHILELDRRTHRYLIEEFSDQTHLMTMLYSRLESFRQSLRKSPKFVIRFLAAIQEGDLRTTLGRNVHTLRVQTHEEPNKLSIKRNFKYSRIPEDQQWRTPIGQELMSVRSKRIQPDEFTFEELNEMLKFICVS